jgi:hypothetical protein
MNFRSFNREIIFDAITFPQKEETPAELTIQYPLALFSKLNFISVSNFFQLK